MNNDRSDQILSRDNREDLTDDPEWRPNNWIATCIGIVLPPFGFLYLNKGLWCVIYLILIYASAAYSLHLRIGLHYSGYAKYIHIELLVIWFCWFHVISTAFKEKIFDLREWYSRWWGISVCFIVNLILLSPLCFDLYRIPNRQMEPTIPYYDKVLVSRFGYGNFGLFGITFMKDEHGPYTDLEKGRIYVYEHPRTNETYISRLMGFPGDVIEYTEGELLVNGQALPREYIREEISESDSELVSGKFSIYRERNDESEYMIQKSEMTNPMFRDRKWYVHKDHVFFISDNRDASYDSRHFGPIHKSNIIARFCLLIPGFEY